MKVKTLG